MSLHRQFLEALPGGEWGSPKIVGEPGGLMADRSIHAKSLWVRGNREAYLKCIIESGESAGLTTRLVANRERLERLEDRLLRVKDEQPPGIVRLYEVRFLDPFPGLLIAMESVQCLKDILDIGMPNVALARKILEAFNSESFGPWMHYDICPKNTGLDDSGACVLIDLDSLYPIDSDEYVRVSVPACKDRVPPDFRREVDRAANEGNLTPELARSKHDREVVLLAAEACLGSFEQPFSKQTVARWCDSSECDEQLISLWRSVLTALADGTKPDIRAILGTLTTFEATEPLLPKETRPRVTHSLDWAQYKDYAQLDGVRRALRGERLSMEQIVEYRKHLSKLTKEQPAVRELWDELLVVTQAYEQNGAEALKVVKEALNFFQGDSAFLRDQRTITLWVGKQ